MRLRIPELLDERGLTPYALAKASGGRVSLSAIYRLRRGRGRVAYLDIEMLDALCDVLGVEPGELFERTAPSLRTGKGKTRPARR